MKVRIKSNIKNYKQAYRDRGQIVEVWESPISSLHYRYHSPERPEEVQAVLKSDTEEIMDNKFEPKSGMIFKAENALGFFIDTPHGLVTYFVRNNKIDSYTTTKNYGFRDGDTKILEVYSSYASLIDLVHRGYVSGTLVWKRESEIKELTLQEVADKFKIPVETLRIKEYKR